jgi:hypothetical protein
VATCTVTALHVDGEPIDMIRWGRARSRRASSRCGDCGVRPGGFHHPGCDLQRCPRCRGRLLTCGCRFDEDVLEDDELTDLELDSNGCPTERISVGCEEVIVHYDDVPEKDVTTVCGIPCTTALRTVIDIAADVEPDHLVRIVDDCLERGLFSVEEARTRLAEADMLTRPGALLLGALLPR